MPKVKKTEEKKEAIKITPKKEKKKISYYFAIGRRKTAVARVKLYINGSGEMKANGKPIGEYFRGEFAKHRYLLPFKITNTENRFNLEAKIVGS